MKPFSISLSLKAVSLALMQNIQVPYHRAYRDGSSLLVVEETLASFPTLSRSTRQSSYTPTGKHLIRRLLASNTPVTVIDAIFYPDELTKTSSENQALLRVHVDDIRNTTALASALTADVVGIIHLAAVSRIGWCLNNANDCMDVNARGTQLVFDALTQLNTKDHGKRWFILASSQEIYGVSQGDKRLALREDDQTIPINVYGASKLAAERVVESRISDLMNKSGPSSGSIHAIAFRLSSVYGSMHDHLERLVPSLVTQGLSHRVIQISGGEQEFDLLHIHDCVDAFMLAISHLTASLRSRSKWAALFTYTPSFSFEVYNISSGFSVKISSLIDTIVNLTRSQSPIRYIAADLYPNVNRCDTTRARKMLGFQAHISVREGLWLLVRAHLQHISLFLSRTIQEKCISSNEYPATTGLPDPRILKLDKCLVHVELNLQDEFVGLTPPDAESEDHWSVRPLNASNLRDPMRSISTLVAMISHPILTNKVNTGDQSYAPANVRLRGWEHETINGAEPFYLGIWRDNKDTPIGPGSIRLERIFHSDLTTTSTVRRPLVDWELHANPHPGETTVRLVMSGTNPPLQLMSPTSIGGNFSLSSVDDMPEKVWNVRISPICCPTPAPWPFVRDDPVEWSMEYQKTSSARPFNASPATAFCDRLARSQKKVQADLVALLSTNFQDTPPLSRKMSRLPTEWAHANLPACSNICSDGHPTECVDTGDCQCVLSSCVRRNRFPFADHAYKNDLSYPPQPIASQNKALTLKESVARASWMSILRPQVASYFSTHPRYPRVHVPSLSPLDVYRLANLKGSDGKILEPDKLLKEHCFSADAQMEKGLMRMETTSTNASEMVFVRHYQGRSLTNEPLEDTYEWVRWSVEGFDESKVIIPFTQDWGQCLTFEWNVWRIRGKIGNTVHPLVRSTTAWSVMGDLNSPCYRPHQDVVIPPRTCYSIELFPLFSSLSSVKPARERHVLATFKGSPWGTGLLHRHRVTCSRAGWHLGEKRTRRLRGLEDRGPNLTAIWSSTGDYDYMGILNNTIFCPQPAGIAGWSPRLIDSIFAGCIPVLIGHSTHPPFFDLLDWSKFSVRVEPSELSQLEDLLLSRYSVDDVERLQTNLMLVRDAFVYPLDDMTDEAAQDMLLGNQDDDARRGPLFWALHSTRMRMLTMWPVADS
ncbi:hypothetical protein DL93DRAFT_2232130 [Clavulina sp. PMI_390]|nr:hypothetical protein DL93DRAFT_2232130 [Clavulina sp. PMI_390]